MHPVATPSLPLGVTIALLAGAFLAHVFVMLTCSRTTQLYFLAAVILVLAPFSGTGGLAAGFVIRWIRAYALLALVVLGIFGVPVGKLRPASLLWGTLILLFVVSGAWSSVPPQALWYKVQIALVVATGIFLAYGVSTREELLRGLRLLSLFAGVLALFMLGWFLVNPQGVLRMGRLDFGATTATRVAGNLAPLLLISTHLALNERSRGWKIIAYSVCTVLGTALLLTGSRGPMAAVVVGLLIQLLPMLGRRARVLLLPALIVVVGFAFLDFVGGSVELDVQRLVSTKNNRVVRWNQALQLIGQKPLLGHGWAPFVPGPYGTVNALNMHSVFFQVAVEAGLLGAVVLLVVVVGVVARSLQAYRFLRRDRLFADMALLPLSLIVATLFHGLGENAAVTPSSFALAMGFGVGLVDCLPRMAMRQRWRTARLLAYDVARRRLAAAGLMRGAQPAG